MCLLLLNACSPSEAELNAQATQAAAKIFTTQTAQAPTITSTPSPSPTSTFIPTSTATQTPTPTPTSTQTFTPAPTRTPKPGQIFWHGDLHMHTTCSDGRNTFEEMVQQALILQFDFIAVTDHRGNGEGRDSRCKGEIIAKCLAEMRLICIPGAEQATNTFHLLAIGIESPVSRVRFVPLLDQVEEIHQHGGFAIAAHPYDDKWGFTEDELIHSGLDAMECDRGTVQQNQAQANLSKEYDIPCVYNSDAHSVAELGSRYIVCSVPINSLADLKAALIGGKCRKN